MNGFTLIELMVVVSITAILMAVVVPGFQSLMASQRIKNATYELMSDMTLARSEALKRGRCVRMVAATGGWALGWTVKADQPAPTIPPTPPPAPTPCPSSDSTYNFEIGQKSKIGGNISFVQSPSAITFDPNGRLTGTTVVARFGLSDGGSNNRCVSLDPAGRPKNANTACPT